MSEQEEVRKASGQFYNALNRMLNGDAGPLTKIWSHDNNVTTMHPIGGQQTGWDDVKKSFEQVAEMSKDGQVNLNDQTMVLDMGANVDCKPLNLYQFAVMGSM